MPKQMLTIRKNQCVNIPDDLIDETNFEDVKNDVEKVDFEFPGGEESNEFNQIFQEDRYIFKLRKELFGLPGKK